MTLRASDAAAILRILAELRSLEAAHELARRVSGLRDPDVALRESAGQVLATEPRLQPLRTELARLTARDFAAHGPEAVRNRQVRVHVERPAPSTLMGAAREVPRGAVVLVDRLDNGPATPAGEREVPSCVWCCISGDELLSLRHSEKRGECCVLLVEVLDAAPQPATATS